MPTYLLVALPKVQEPYLRVKSIEGEYAGPKPMVRGSLLGAWIWEYSGFPGRIDRERAI